MQNVLKLIVFSLLALKCLPTAEAATLLVPSSYATIQAALDSAVSGDTVSVAPGIYYEHNLSFNGKDIHLLGQAGASITTVDGGQAGPVFVFNGAETRNAVIEGFTIQNGVGDYVNGGGIYIVNASPTIKRNTIKNNQAVVVGAGGGGIKVSTGSNPLIENNTITNNQAHKKGGGIHVYNASAEIRGNTITFNTVIGDSQSAGGGVGASYATMVRIEDNTITQNTAPFAGGGISVYAGSADIINNSITFNDGGQWAGGVHIEAASGADVAFLVHNNVIKNNTAHIGGGIHSFMSDTASTVTISHNEIADNASVGPGCASPYSSTVCGYGGGLALYSSPTGSDPHWVHHNDINNNRADLYAAALFEELPVVFEDNTVTGNHSLYNYAGVACAGAGVTESCMVRRNLFANQYCENSTNLGRPGALYLKNVGNGMIENNCFYQNQGNYAGAVLITNCSAAIPLINNTFNDNQTEYVNCGSVRGESDIDLINNVFKGDQLAVRMVGSASAARVWNNNFHGQTSSYFMIDQIFRSSVAELNAEAFAQGNTNYNPGTLSQDCHLSSDSACIDRGTDAFAPDDDIDGQSRPEGSGFDQGADEYVAQAPLVTTTSATSIKDVSASAVEATLNGTIVPRGVTNTTYYFEYGPDSGYGQSTSALSLGPGETTVNVSRTLGNLDPNQTYHFRLVAQNSAGTTYGADSIFSTDILYVSSQSGCSGHLPCFQSLNVCIQSASVFPAIIKVSSDSFFESITADQSSAAYWISGGWSSDFNTVSTPSKLEGKLSVSGSEVIIYNLSLQ